MNSLETHVKYFFFFKEKNMIQKRSEHMGEFALHLFNAGKHCWSGIKHADDMNQQNFVNLFGRDFLSFCKWAYNDIPHTLPPYLIALLLLGHNHHLVRTYFESALKTYKLE